MSVSTEVWKVKLTVATEWITIWESFLVEYLLGLSYEESMVLCTWDGLIFFWHEVVLNKLNPVGLCDCKIYLLVKVIAEELIK